ncbi:MAG TPA: efflux RND transporter permease subunit [Spirochaetota bacterium]|nr:efflux RND transporter permease subunit [Spirochaetota bacterium]HQQ22323.1 efflux RND transporter permease subunit [Spirochaetota bacterium]
MGAFFSYLSRQKQLAVIVVIMIVGAGLFTFLNTNREAYPQVNFDMVTVKTIYPGGSPEEIENLITTPIEKKIKEVSGLDKVRSYNIENVSVIVVYIDMNQSNTSEIVTDIKDAVDLVEDLPSNAEKPIVEELKLDKTQVVDIALFGKDDSVKYEDLRMTADKFKDFLEDIEGVAEVEDYGFFDREWLVEADPNKLEKYHLALNDIVNAIKLRNLDLPGGSLYINEKEYILRTKGQYQTINEVLNTVISSNDYGFTTRIADVATVKDTVEEADSFERVNGKTAVVFTVKKKREYDEIDMSQKIRENIKKFSFGNVEYNIFLDQSDYTERQVSSVISNALLGLVLCAGIIIVFLGIRMASIITICFPVSFMLGFLGMNGFGITINVISMFGMIMVLGMIVDASIVVSENTHRYMELGHRKTNAIAMGIAEVWKPLLLSFCCVFAAFMPLAILTGIIGKFVKAIPIVLLICLAGSQICALFILPSFLNMFLSSKHGHDALPDESELVFAPGFFGFMQRKYKAFLEKAIRHRYLTFMALFSIFVSSILMIGCGIVKFQFMPGGGEEKISIKCYFPNEYNLGKNLSIVKPLEDITNSIFKEGELKAIRSRVGTEDFGLLDPQPGEGSHKSTIVIYLTPEQDRERTATEFTALLNEAVNKKIADGTLPKEALLKIEMEKLGPPVGKPINVEIRGEDFPSMIKAAQEYIDYLNTIPGVHGVRMDMEDGKYEFRYKIDEVMAKRTGVSVTAAATALNASFEGSVASSAKIGDEEVDIRVRFPMAYKRTISSLNDVMVSNSSGGLVPLSKIASIEKKRGVAFINRLNFKRLVQVQAEIDIKKTTSFEVNKMLKEKFKDIETRYQNTAFAYGGEQEDSDKSMKDLGILFLIAMAVIFILLSAYFEHVSVAVILMSAIPFSMIGVVFGLFLHGQPFSFMGCLGVFALAGVIVSNSTVLVDFIQNLREKGVPFEKALVVGGVSRVRPVLLTSGTTILGLLPSVLEIGGKDYFVRPLSIAFMYGLIFATMITLILVPCMYRITEDIKHLFHLRREAKKLALAEVETIPVFEEELKEEPKKRINRKKK